MATNESKIIEAWTLLILLNKNKNAPDVDTYKNKFLDACSGAQCAEATLNIFNKIGVVSYTNCNMINALFQGDGKGTYYTGMRDQVTSKGGYLTTLISMGIILESAY